jgi:hypothetical protein
MKVCVIDGMGGKIGAQIIFQVRENFPDLEIYALATNAVAAHQMLKAGANKGASGENAIIVTVKDVDIIIGPLAIVIPNSMMGELTPKMAEAIASSPAQKILLPITYPTINLVGVEQKPLPHLMEEGLAILQKLIREGEASV